MAAPQRTAVSNCASSGRHGGSDVGEDRLHGICPAANSRSPSTCRAPKEKSRGAEVRLQRRGVEDSSGPRQRRRPRHARARRRAAQEGGVDVLHQPGFASAVVAPAARSRRPSAAPTNPATPGPDRARGARAAARRRWPAARIADQHRRVRLEQHRRQIGRADEVVRTDAVYLLEPHPGRAARTSREVEPRATRPTVQLRERTCETRLTDSTGPSSRSRCPQHDEIGRVAQVLHDGDRPMSRSPPRAGR